MKALLARSKKKLQYRPRYSVTVYGSNPVKIKDIAHCLRESVTYRFTVNEVLDTGTPLVEQLAKCDPSLDLFLIYDDFREFVEHHPSRRNVKTPDVAESHFEHMLKSTAGKETPDVPLVILLEGREADLSAKGRVSLGRCLNNGVHDFIAGWNGSATALQHRIHRLIVRLRKVDFAHNDVLVSLNPNRKTSKKRQKKEQRMKALTKMRSMPGSKLSALVTKARVQSRVGHAASMLKASKTLTGGGLKMAASKVKIAMAKSLKEKKLNKFHMRRISTMAKLGGDQGRFGVVNSSSTGGLVGTVSSIVDLKRRQNLNRTKDAVALLRKKKYDTAVHLTGNHTRKGSMGKQMMTLALDQDEDFSGGVDDIEIRGGVLAHGANTKLHMAALEKSYLQDTQIPKPSDILCAKLRGTTYKLSVNSRVSGAFKQGLEYQVLDKFRKALKMFTICCKREAKAPVVFHHRGMCHFALGNFEKAKEDFSTCIKLEEKAAEPLERLKRATAKTSSSTNSKIGRGIAAPPTLTSDVDTLQNGPQKRFVQIATTHALFNRALCLLHLHKSKQALRDFDRALHVDSGDSEIIEMRALTLRRKGDFGAAYKDYQQLARLRVVRRNKSIAEEPSDDAVETEIIDTVAEREAADVDGDGHLDLEEFKDAMNFVEKPHAKLVGHVPLSLIALMETPPGRRNEVQKLQIIDLLHSYSFFRNLDAKRQREIAQLIHYDTVESGVRILHEGERPTALCLVYSGAVSLKKIDEYVGADRTLNVLFSGSTFGQDSLCNGTTSAVSADAREPVEMFLLDRVDFQRLGLGEHFRTELENRVRTLEDCGLFTGETLWDKQELRELAKVAMPLVFKRGSIILEQGAKLGTLYVLKRGVCRVVQKSDYEKELRRRKGELEKSLDSFDMNYIYHHERLFDDIGDPKEADGVDKPSAAEQRRARMVKELKVVSERLERELERKAKEANEKEGKERKRTWKPLSFAKHHVEGSELKLGVLLPPAIFGETILVDARCGVEPASVIAETSVEVLMVKLLQLDQDKISDAFRAKVVRKTMKYPAHSELTRRVQSNEDWQRYKSYLMEQVPKWRWPVEKSRIQRLGNGGFVVRDAEE